MWFYFDEKEESVSSRSREVLPHGASELQLQDSAFVRV
jgi:hypothetical protein